jgi:catechol 2,3-dioxygenase-like lactoylglutathione lyase family enzyme
MIGVTEHLTEPDAMPRTSGILETSLYVDDLPGAVAFYRDLFGFELFFHEPRMAALGVPGGQVLLLFQRGATLDHAPGPGGGFIPPHHGEGPLHLCFAIPFGELAAWEAHLHAHGIEVESRLSWARGGTSLYFRDPEGNSLEVATPGLWPNA